MSGIYPISFSRMQVFDQCELRFDRQYVTADCKDAGSDASKYGNRVHDDFESCLRDGTPLPDDLARFTPLLDSFKSKPGVKHYELKMAVTRDKEPCGWDAPDCWVRGIADVAVTNGTLGFAADWKTGKPKEDSLQLLLMACLLFAHFPALVSIKTSYIWLFHPQAAAQPVTHVRWSLDDYWKVFEKKIKNMDAAVVQGVFKPKPSGLCPWCPAYNSCSYAKRR